MPSTTTASDLDERAIVTELHTLALAMARPSEHLHDLVHPEYAFSRQQFDLGARRLEALVARLATLRP